MTIAEWTEEIKTLKNADRDDNCGIVEGIDRKHARLNARIEDMYQELCIDEAYYILLGLDLAT